MVAVRKHPAGPASKSAPPVWHRWRRGFKNANFKSWLRTRAISFCPLIPVSSSKTAIGAGPERNLAGNAIDFCVQVLGLSFHDDMRLITGA